LEQWPFDFGDEIRLLLIINFVAKVGLVTHDFCWHKQASQMSWHIILFQNSTAISACQF